MLFNNCFYYFYELLDFYRDNNGRRLMDYLFLVPKRSGEVLDHNKVLENGIVSSTEQNVSCCCCSNETINYKVSIVADASFFNRHGGELSGRGWGRGRGES